MYTFSDIYKSYVGEYGHIAKEVFSDICHTFNIGIMEYILEGKEFNMGNNLSTLSSDFLFNS